MVVALGNVAQRPTLARAFDPSSDSAAAAGDPTRSIVVPAVAPADAARHTGSYPCGGRSILPAVDRLEDLD